MSTVWYRALIADSSDAWLMIFEIAGEPPAEATPASAEVVACSLHGYWDGFLFLKNVGVPGGWWLYTQDRERLARHIVSLLEDRWNKGDLLVLEGLAKIAEGQTLLKNASRNLAQIREDGKK